jgi:hypothetical protein
MNKFHNRALALMLAKPPEMSEDELRLRGWLKSNRKSLEGLTPAEVARMAIFCDVAPMDVVLRTLSNFRCAMTGGFIENLAAKELLHFEMTVDRVNKLREDKELDLDPLWEDLVNNFENETRKEAA